MTTEQTILTPHELEVLYGNKIPYIFGEKKEERAKRLQAYRDLLYTVKGTALMCPVCGHLYDDSFHSKVDYRGVHMCNLCYGRNIQGNRECFEGIRTRGRCLDCLNCKFTRTGYKCKAGLTKAGKPRKKGLPIKGFVNSTRYCADFVSE